jgi:hypothetical protein
LYAVLPPIDVIYLRFGLLVWYVRKQRIDACMNGELVFVCLGLVWHHIHFAREATRTLLRILLISNTNNIV